tara:strand:- start:89 stop:418 length:330 start_codon:yes stop_codon:yes gene_type:complete
MKNIETNHLFEYLCFFLIMSYFFIHNIIYVIIGITISFYLINIKNINSYVQSINKKLVLKKVYKELDKNNKLNNSDSINIKSTKTESKLTLVETIEELGYIPSLDEKTI